MHVQKIENNSITFGIGITPSMYKRASHYYNEVLHDRQMFNRFYRKAKFVQNNFGHDDCRLLFGRDRRPNACYYTLRVLKLGEPEENALEIFAHKRFGTLMESFIHMKEEHIDNVLARVKSRK